MSPEAGDPTSQCRECLENDPLHSQSGRAPFTAYNAEVVAPGTNLPSGSPTVSLTRLDMSSTFSEASPRPVSHLKQRSPCSVHPSMDERAGVSGSLSMSAPPDHISSATEE